jgi:hypothetical protein
MPGTSSDAAAASQDDETRSGVAFPFGIGFSDPGEWCRGRCARQPGNFPQVGDPDQSVLACEREGLVAAPSLRDAENSVRSGIVDRDRALVVDYQPTGVGKHRYRRSFCAPTAPGLPNPAGHQSAGPDIDR